MRAALILVALALAGCELQDAHPGGQAEGAPPVVGALAPDAAADTPVAAEAWPAAGSVEIRP